MIFKNKERSEARHTFPTYIFGFFRYNHVIQVLHAVEYSEENTIRKGVFVWHRRQSH